MITIVNDPRLQPNFKLSEIVCNCGCEQVMLVPQSLEVLQNLRDILNERFKGNCYITVAAGYRCPKHNANVEGASPNSRHTYVGDAYDIKCYHNGKQIDPSLIARYAVEAGFKGIGAYKYQGKFFNHVDCREKKNYWIQRKDGTLMVVANF